MTQDNGSIGLKGAAYVPNDIYVGTNVVRRHVAEFFYTAAHQGLLAEGEQVLAVFDCVILEPSGARLGGLTLHDYAVLTDRHLITWGRGNNRDIVDKFPWADVNVAKYGSRSPIEGVVKFIYGQRPISNQKRKINLSSRPEGATVAVPPEPVVKVGMTGGVTLYLDLIPIDEVRTLAFMMEYLVGDGESVPSADDFRSHFNAQIQESAARLSHINSLLAPFYVEQPNGVLIEADAVEEDNLRRAAGRKRNPPSPYSNPETPYRGSGGGITRVREERPVRVPTPRPAAPPPAARPRDIESSGGGGLNRGNRQVSTGAPGSNEPRTIGLRETVSLNTSPLNLPSKLDAYEGRATGARPAASSAPAPRPERAVVPSRPTPPPRPAPAPRPEPTVRVETEPTPRASGMVMDDIQTGNLPSDRPLVVPVGVVLGREALNVYSLSRLARGLWIDPRNLGRNVSDLGDTASVLVEITNLLNDDVLVRRTALFRLRDALNSGVIARNPIFHYTIWPFIKPILDAIRLPGERRRAAVPNRVRVRANGNGKHNGNGKNGGTRVSATTTAAPDVIKVDVPPTTAAPPPKPNGGSIKVNIVGEAPAVPLAPDNEPPTRVPSTLPDPPVSPAPPTPAKEGVTEVPADFLGKEKPESPAAVNAATSSNPAAAARETIQPGEQNAQPMANQSADKAKAEAIATDDGPPEMPSADLLQPEGDDAPLNTSGSSTDTLSNLDRPDDQPTPKSKLDGV